MSPSERRSSLIPPKTIFEPASLATADLVLDAVYGGGRSGNSSDDPLTHLVGVSNQGGFRYLGNVEAPKLIVLTSNFNDPNWPDHLDRETGLLTYYGDNKKPGRGIHETPRNGNVLLRNAFDAMHSRPPRREKVPPFLIFGNAGSYRDMVFLGLAVPGAPGLSGFEDLVAVWKVHLGQRFQNYRSIFTVLDIPRISRKWIDDIKTGNPLSSNCPAEWKAWVLAGRYRPLRAEQSSNFRTKAEQLPTGDASGIIRLIYDRFQSDPILFERCAAMLVQLMDRNVFSFDLTRPSRDGGRDAIGLYRIGHGRSGILVDFAVEAKCYRPGNAVGVRELSRLISRLRHRQFGVLVTTSYLHAQAYQELKDDNHPVIVVSATDIVAILATAGMTTLMDVKNWLESNFPAVSGSSGLSANGLHISVNGDSKTHD